MKKLLAVISVTIAVLVSMAFVSPHVEGLKVKLAVNAPEKAKLNEEFTVELTVNKDGESGFCKLEQMIPLGFIATEIESQNQGAVFIFEAQTVKFIWLQIPANNQIKVKYKVKIDPSVVPDKYKFEGRFSYTENRKIKRVEAPKWDIQIDK